VKLLQQQSTLLYHFCSQMGWQLIAPIKSQVHGAKLFLIAVHALGM
jgi:hypothetical protein